MILVKQYNVSSGSSKFLGSFSNWEDAIDKVESSAWAYESWGYKVNWVKNTRFEAEKNHSIIVVYATMD